MWTVLTFESHDTTQRTYENRKEAYLETLDHHLRWLNLLSHHLEEDGPSVFKKEWIKNYLQTIETLKEDLENDNYDNELYVDETVILTEGPEEVKLVYTISNQELYFYTDLFGDPVFVQSRPIFDFGLLNLIAADFDDNDY